jgi:hypothetical protein
MENGSLDTGEFIGSTHHASRTTKSNGQPAAPMPLKSIPEGIAALARVLYGARMGYWGYIVAAKDERPLNDIPELSAFGDDYVKVEPLHGGWQKAWVAGASDDPLVGVEALARATDGPVIGAFILDSDCGPVAATTPSGASWAATLAKATAIDSYQMPDDGVSADAAMAALRLWAEQAGLQTGLDLMREALDENARGPERLFGLLLEAMGIAHGQH